MKKLQTLLIALLLTGSLFAQSGVFYNVKDYGAKGDGQTIDTKAIEAAIDAAAAKGGGTVFFPAGNYQSFTIHLKSFITLHLDNGATLEAADVKKFGLGYDPAEPNPWDMYLPVRLVTAISIPSKGMNDTKSQLNIMVVAVAATSPRE